MSLRSSSSRVVNKLIRKELESLIKELRSMTESFICNSLKLKEGEWVCTVCAEKHRSVNDIDHKYDCVVYEAIEDFKLANNFEWDDRLILCSGCKYLGKHSSGYFNHDNDYCDICN